MISFKQYLYESEGIYDAMRSSIEDRIRKAHKKAQDDGIIKEPEFKESHIKEHGLHHSLLDSNGIRSEIEIENRPQMFGLKTDKTYNFSINQKNGRSHKVQVEFSDHHDNITDVGFKVNGFFANMGTVSPHDHQTQHAIYSGVMDAIAHINYEHGPKQFTFHAYDANSVLERRKAHRYEKIAKVLRAR
jgi:hypothetical protein